MRVGEAVGKRERYSDKAHFLIEYLDISHVSESDDKGDTWGELTENVYLYVADGEVLIEKGVEKCSIHGNQVLQIRLTKNDIANLVKIAWGKESFGDLVDALSRTTPSA